MFNPEENVPCDIISKLNKASLNPTESTSKRKCMHMAKTLLLIATCS